MKSDVDYLDKYLKRPPIGETRIKLYDGKTVTYEYLDHYTDVYESMRSDSGLQWERYRFF